MNGLGFGMKNRAFRDMGIFYKMNEYDLLDKHFDSNSSWKDDVVSDYVSSWGLYNV